MHLALIGYRGTGKTSVARALAERLGRPWFDLDEELEKLAGKSIREIFAAQGEGAFRDLEAEVLADHASRKDDCILATGGGVILRQVNRQVLQDRATVVWLRARAETIEQRLAGDATTTGRRPNLTMAGGREEIVQLLAAREPWYAQTALFSVDTDALTPDEIAERIVSELPDPDARGWPGA